MKSIGADATERAARAGRQLKRSTRPCVKSGAKADAVKVTERTRMRADKSSSATKRMSLDGTISSLKRSSAGRQFKAKTGKNVRNQGSAKTEQATPAEKPKTVLQHAQVLPRKPANDPRAAANGQRLVQLSVRMSDADRWVVHGTAAALGMDAQALVILALQAYGVDIAKAAPPPNNARRQTRDNRSKPIVNHRQGTVSFVDPPSRELEIIDAVRELAVDIIDGVSAALVGNSRGRPVRLRLSGKNIKQRQSRKKRIRK